MNDFRFGEVALGVWEHADNNLHISSGVKDDDWGSGTRTGYIKVGSL